MKRVVLSIIIVLICMLTNAQVPDAFNYQAIPRNSSGGVYPDQSMKGRFSILAGIPTGTSVYVETFSATTSSLGILNLQVGKGTLLSGNFSTIDWGSNSYFLKVEIDPIGGTSYVEMGTTQLLSVPYAMYSKTSETSTDAVKITGDQSIAGIKTFTGNINASNKVISNVATPLSTNDAANKAYVDLLKERIAILEGSVAKDMDDNVYSTVELGSQIWMAENLRTTHYKDGTSIPLVTYAGDWFKVSGPGYCWYNNQEATYKSSYGALYNWYAVRTENLCPTGWHVPTDAEWTTLTTYLGGTLVAGAKLKESGITHWQNPNTGATNETGFTALPGGSRSATTGVFDNLRGQGYWWSSTESSLTTAWVRSMSFDNGAATKLNNEMKSGFSVRCVKN